MSGLFYGRGVVTSSGLTPLTSSTDGAVVQWSTSAGAFIASTTLSAFVPGTATAWPKVIHRTSNSNTITANTTLANDDTLQFAVGTTDSYFVDAFLMFTAADSTGAAATADLKVGWSGPASSTMQWAAMSTPATGSPTWSGAATSATLVVLKDITGSQSFGAVAGLFGLSLAGFYQSGGTGGTVAFQWAQNTSNAATIQIMANSMLRLTRLA